MNHIRPSRLIIPLLLCLTLCAGPESAIAADKKKAAATTTSTTKAKSQSSKQSASKKSKAKKAPPRQSSASLKKQEQSINQEIQLTKSQIEENEAAVKENLAVLTNLEHDIELQNRKITELKATQNSITADIANCGVQIQQCEASLQGMRSRYVQTVKKMRLARKKANPLAYIFAAKNFYQAWRRMRYMQKYNDWRAKREAEIKQQVARLGQLQSQLTDKQAALQTNLADQQQAQKTLAAKHIAQDEAVKALRAHGDALRKHLAQKQAEANALSAKVVELIAIEQQEAAQAAERARKAAQEKADREKAEKERAEKIKAENERMAREKAQKEKAEREKAQKQKEEQEKQKKQKKQKEQKAKDDTKKKIEPAKPVTPKNPEDTKSNSEDYAKARGRSPRTSEAGGNSSTSSGSASSGSSSSSTAASSTATATAKATSPASGAIASGFAAAKGSLPRPVSGQFSIVSHFGPHPLPDLPDVKFDNPGIDAVVATGASAQAVYDGTVTGVYVLPGFSTVVIVSHGEYYTVYGNIGTPSVSKGDKVKQGQALGHLVSDPDEGGRTTIHFEIYKNREKLNPEAWIR